MVVPEPGSGRPPGTLSKDSFGGSTTVTRGAAPGAPGTDSVAYSGGRCAAGGTTGADIGSAGWVSRPGEGTAGRDDMVDSNKPHCPQP